MNGNQPDQSFGRTSSVPPQAFEHERSASSSSATTPARDGLQTAEQLKQKANQTATHVASQAKDTVAQVKQDVTHQVYAATEQIKTVGRDYATRKKSQAVAELDGFRDAMLRASDKLKEENHETVGCYVAAAAEQIGRLRTTLEQRDVQSLLNDAQSLTRRHPEVVYGGLFVAGVALMRFLKASHRDEASALASRRDIMYSSAQGRAAAGRRTTSLSDVNTGSQNTDSQKPARPLTASSSYQTGQSLDKPANPSSDARIIPSIPPSGNVIAPSSGTGSSSSTRRT